MKVDAQAEREVVSRTCRRRPRGRRFRKSRRAPCISPNYLSFKELCVAVRVFRGERKLRIDDSTLHMDDFKLQINDSKLGMERSKLPIHENEPDSANAGCCRPGLIGARHRFSGRTRQPAPKAPAALPSRTGGHWFESSTAHEER